MNELVGRQTEARTRADRIRSGLVSYVHLLQDIADAYAARDWDVLGYGSWKAYTEAEFGSDQVKLPRAERQKAVAELMSKGMSTRAVGDALGIAQNTVLADKQVTQIESPAEVTGLDGKTYTRPEKTEPPVIDAEVVSEEVDMRPYHERAADSSCGIDNSDKTALRITRKYLEGFADDAKTGDLRPEIRESLTRLLKQTLTTLERNP